MGTNEATLGQEEGVLREILELVRERTGADFTQYRNDTVRRRVHNRMISLGASSERQYLALLTAREREAFDLVQRVTIKVSRFYRNPVAFDFLREHVLPELARARRGAPLTLWSAGTACGEEAYTLAMLLEEQGLAGTVDATDIDPGALRAAHEATYDAASFTDLPPALASRYLVTTRSGARTCFRVSDPVRARVRFTRHDLTSTAELPFGPFDLVCCRNVLIYFQRAVQERALERLFASVRDEGFLFLGEAEWPSAQLERRLDARAKKARIFQRRTTQISELP